MKKVKTVPIPFSGDYRYMTDYDYDNEYNCEDEGCNDEGICRCGRIVDFRLNSWDSASIAQSEFKNIEGQIGRALSEIEKYAIERCVRYLVCEDNFEADIGGGYYGEELDGVTLNNAAELWESVQNILALTTDLEKIHWILKLEYGSIADNIQYKTNAFEASMLLGDIEMPSASRVAAVTRASNPYDDKWIVKYQTTKHLAGHVTMAIAIVREENGKYILVDGYTRISSLKKNFKDKYAISVIILS